MAVTQRNILVPTKLSPMNLNLKSMLYPFESSESYAFCELSEFASFLFRYCQSLWWAVLSVLVSSSDVG